MRKLARRDFLGLSAAVAAGAVAAACAPAAPQIIEREVIKEVPVEKPVVVEKEVAKVVEKEVPKEVIKEVEVEKVVRQTVVVEKEVVKEVLVKPEPVEITYWHSWGGLFGDLVDRTADLFMAANPDVKVKLLRVEWGPGGAEFTSKVMTSVAGGAPPDSVMAWNEEGLLYSLAAQEIILAIEDVADPNEILQLKEAVSPFALEIGTYEGKLWALPQWLQAYMLCCSLDLLEEAGIDPESPPETLDELDAIADQLYKFDAQGNIEQLGFDTGGWIFPWAGVFNAQMVDENGAPTATHENNVRALEYMVSYAEKYDVAKINQFLEGFEEIGNPMLVGKQAISEEGPWFEGVVLRDKPEFRWTVWSIPRPAWLDGHGQASGGDIPVIVSGTKHPEAAWQWVHYLTGVVDPKAYATLWSIGGYPHMPTSEIVATGPAFEDIRRRFPKFVEYIEDFYNADWVFVPPKTPIAKFYFDRLGSWVERARLLEVTPQEALEGLQAEATTEWDNWLAAH